MGLFKKDAWEDYHKHAAKRDIKVRKALMEDEMHMQLRQQREQQRAEAEAKRKEMLHESFCEQISDFKERIKEVKTCTSLDEKLLACINIYSAVDKIRSEANKENDSGVKLDAKMILSEVDNCIERIPFPQAHDQQLDVLALLVRSKASFSSIKKWKEELAQKARQQYHDSAELKPYLDKILGKEIPSDASIGTKLKIFLSNIFR